MRQEIEDLNILVQCFITTILVWTLLLGWNLTDLIPNYDALGNLYLITRELCKVHGNWRELIFRPDILGGVEIYEMGHTPPLLEVLASRNISPLAALNLIVIFIQATFAFLMYKTASSWVRVENSQIPALIRVPLLAMLSFSPVLAWRIYFGHLNLLFGSFVFISTVALVVCFHARTTSTVFLSIVCACLVNAFASAGQQMILYSFIFGAPIIVTLIFHLLRQNNSRGVCWLSPLLILVGCIGISTPRMSLLLNHALSADFSRMNSNEIITYSYIVSNFKDWINSIPWTPNISEADRPFLHWHEVNYPIGPIAILLLSSPLRNSRALVIGFGLSLLFIVLLSINLGPISEFSLKALPPLRYFRVPARGMILIELLVSVLATSAILHLSSRRTIKERELTPIRTLGFPVALIAFHTLSSAILEALCWSLCSAITWISSQQRSAKIKFPLLVFAALNLSVSSISAFRERSLPFTNAEYFRKVDSLAQQLRREYPELDFPLSRGTFDKFYYPFGVSSGFAFGISTLDGYWSPSRRFLELVSTLEGVPIDVGRNYFDFDLNSSTFDILRKLYNVRYSVIEQNGRITLRGGGTTLGPAWFSSSLTSMQSMEDLVAQLKNLGTLDVNALVLVNDVKTNFDLGLPTFSKDCRLAKVHLLQGQRGQQRFRFSIDTPATCPLTVSMNYFSDLRVTGIISGQSRIRLRTFPSYGALLGIFIPQGTTEVIIEPDVTVPIWSWPCFMIGILTVLAVLLPHGFRIIRSWER